MEQVDSLKTTTDLEGELKMYLNPMLNYEPRFFGYPVGEFFIFVFLCFVIMKVNIILSIPAFVVLILFKKKREAMPKDWFMYIPYASLHVPYGYLLPPGKRTFLP